MITRDTVLQLIKFISDEKSMVDRRIEHNGKKYILRQEHESNWVEEPKYDLMTRVCRLFEIREDGKLVPTEYLLSQEVARKGEYYGDYEYIYEDPTIVRAVTVMECVTKYVPEDEKSDEYIEEVRCPKCNSTKYELDCHGYNYMRDTNSESSKYYTCECGTKFKVTSLMRLCNRKIEIG